jgi:hypothetical protein
MTAAMAKTGIYFISICDKFLIKKITGMGIWM